MASVIKPSAMANLSIAPSRLALAKLEQQLSGQFDAPFKLKDALAPIVKDYDYIIIDTPPALGILTVNAMVASTHLLVPIQAAYFAIEGTDDLLETYERIRARPNPSLKMLGVVITIFVKRTNISRDTHEQIRTVFGEVLFKTKISKNVRLEESPAYKETILTFAPKSPGAVEYKKLALEVIQRVEENRLASHAEDAAWRALRRILNQLQGRGSRKNDSGGPDSPEPGPAAQSFGRFARTDRFDSREGRAGAAAGAVYCARGLLLHYFG